MAPFGPGARALVMIAGGLVSVGAVACIELPLVAAGECGNQVYEPESGEDCDGTAAAFGDSARCGAPNSAAACRLTCSSQGSVEAQCPPGWGCGTDGICRQPTAQYEFDSLPGQARGVGDLDGDGLTDVVMRSNQGAIQVAFFSESRNLAEVFTDPARRPLSDEPAVEPVIGRMTNDGIDDIALPLINDEVDVRLFMGSADRSLDDPFVELITVPFEGDIEVLEVFNPWGAPQGLCDVGGCRESLLLAKRAETQTRYSVLDDRKLVELFTLQLGRKQQSWAVERWDQGRSCDILGVTYRASQTGSPGNTADFFSLCEGEGFNQSSERSPLGSVDPIATVSVSDFGDALSLRIAGTSDIDGNGWPDLLLNATDNNPASTDEPRGYVLYGSGDGHFNSRVDFTGMVDMADRDAPLLGWHSWVAPEDELAVDHGTWPRAVEDINADGRADFLLSAGIIVLSTQDPGDVCRLGSEVLISGPLIGMEGEAQWGYSCLVVTDDGLVPGAAVLSRDDLDRDWWVSNSLARVVDLNGDGQPGFAAIAKGQVGNTGQQIDHSPPDFLDLLWIDPSSQQLVLQTLEAERFEQVAAGDIDGDFIVDLVIDNGRSLQVIRGAPFELPRATDLSPVGFDVLEVFGEGRPSASVGAERDGRLTILRDGEWPALALTEREQCDDPEDCHVRFASGALSGGEYFAWALAVIDTTEGGGLRVLRAIEGEANLGPASDSIAEPLVSLSELGLSAEASAARVIAVELGGDDDGREEAVIVARTPDGVELAVLRARLETNPQTALCSPSFVVTLDDGTFDDQAVCFEVVDSLFIPGTARSTDPSRSLDPFVEVADADGDGNLDLSWVTFDNSVVVLLGDGSGTLRAGQALELSLPEPEAEDEAEAENNDPGDDAPARIDWIRWMEFDGSEGLELVSGDLLGSQTLWGLDADIESAELSTQWVLEVDNSGAYPGLPGDFDGDGVHDLAIGSVMMFGRPVNE